MLVSYTHQGSHLYEACYLLNTNKSACYTLGTQMFAKGLIKRKMCTERETYIS